MIKEFWELEAWKQAHGLTLKIYEITSSFPKEERYGVTDQLRRASSSVSANIAEGFERYHFKDKQRFYFQARASAAEVQNFLFLSKDLGYILEDVARPIFVSCISVKKLINGLIRSIEKQKN